MAAGRSRAAGRSALAAMRRRKMYRHFWNRYGNYIIAGVLFAVILTTVVVIAAAFDSTGATGQQGTEVETTPDTETETAADQQEEDAEEIPYPFNQMSRDWDGEDLAGFKPYTIPKAYERAGGTFPEVMQQFTYIICTQNNVDYAVVVAMIEAESGYKWDAGGLDGDTGYMQIVQKWHEDRMERLNAQNLLNPFQNVEVGIDYLAELLEKYGGDYEKALTAYQYGSSGAYKFFFSAGENSSQYARNVLEIAERIRRELGGND